MKHVQGCLKFKRRSRKQFHHCGDPVRLVQACLFAGKT